ncbi:Ig heavy chain V region C3, partial [Manacus vitellinus]
GLWAQWRLEEAGGGHRAPGDSVLLSCCGSRFSFGDYDVWSLETPRGSLECVSFIDSWGRVMNNRAAVQDRATASKDNSQSKSSLSLLTLHPQDYAPYFCALHTG